MLVLSVTLSSPLLAPNIIIRLPHAEPPSAVLHAPFPAEMLTGYGTDYRRSGNYFRVYSFRFGWLPNGIGRNTMICIMYDFP